MSDSVTWWGHAMVGIDIGGVRLLTDPLLRRRIGPLRWYGRLAPPSLASDVDAVLISHLHRDHLDLPSLRRFGPGTVVIVPRGAGDVAGRAVRGQVHEVRAGDVVAIGALSVTVVPAEHPGDRDPFRPNLRAAPVGYVVAGTDGTGTGRRVYFAGDTALYDGLGDIGPGLDLALLPVGGWGLTLGTGHLDPRTAVDALELLKPRRAVPIHWGTLRVPALWRTRPSLYRSPGPDFVAQAARVGGPTGPDGVVLAAPGRPLPLA